MLPPENWAKFGDRYILAKKLARARYCKQARVTAYDLVSTFPPK